MPFSWHVLAAWLMLLWLCSSSEALCPPFCTCKQTEKGKRKVSCMNGGMVDPIPASQMDPGMEIIEISAPEDGNWNSLTIAAIFQAFKFLEEIHVRRSNIKQIGMHALWGVPTLKVLDLACNNISAVFDHNFRGLVNLVELNLDDNNIRSLQFAVFKHLTELRILSLQRNFIEELVPRTFYKLAKLHVLKLNGNKFKELSPEAFKDLPELRVLECRSCNLKRINTQIYHLLPYLAHLDFGDNFMPFMADDDFLDLHKLHSLKLDGNLFPVILEKTFVKQTQLRYLCLARNRIVKMTHTALMNLTSLVELDISYNKMKVIEPETLKHISGTLQRLVISGNYLDLDEIKVVLYALQKVLNLEIAKMNLTSIPERFLLDRIKKLNISHNGLTEIKLESLPKHLLELDVSGNKLRGIDERLVLKLENLKSVHLHNNSWSCDLCHITPMLLRVNRTDIFKNLQCASPSYLEGRLLNNLQLEDLTSCEDLSEGETHSSKSSKNKLTLVIGLTSLIVFLLLCVTFVVFSCKRRRQHAFDEQKRLERQQSSIEHPQAIFSKGEISFKFPLDLTDRKLSVSTIDEIKKDTQLQTLPNGTGI